MAEAPAYRLDSVWVTLWNFDQRFICNKAGDFRLVEK